MAQGGTTMAVGPVTVQVTVPYSLPFIGSAITLRGRATMRLEQELDLTPTGGCV